jgi:hypothetical protein
MLGPGVKDGLGLVAKLFIFLQDASLKQIYRDRDRDRDRDDEGTNAESDMYDNFVKRSARVMRLIEVSCRFSIDLVTLVP